MGKRYRSNEGLPRLGKVRFWEIRNRTPCHRCILIFQKINELPGGLYLLTSVTRGHTIVRTCLDRGFSLG